ncbi:MAG TPA: glucokinase [Syntrophales bacterium]|nr:glucokinase [Syntrophales bacterium]
MALLLAGDIGGTNTRLGLFSEEKDLRSPLKFANFRSGDFSSLAAIVKEFLKGAEMPVTAACFGVAGPVVQGVARITNLPWTLDEKRLASDLKLRAVRLVNDLGALAFMVPLLEERDIHALNEGMPVPGGNCAVIAPGTGLGEAFLTWEGERYRGHPSEGGHADFAPGNKLEGELLAYLQEKLGHVSYESVCSGPGILNIYCFLREKCYAEEPSWLSSRLTGARDPVPIIAEGALEPAVRCDLCVMTFNLFASILGAEAGNMALKVMATGGVYLGGGIPRRIMPYLGDGRFIESFRYKGRMSGLVSRMPVFVILDPQVALLGAAGYGLELLRGRML